MKFFFLIIDPGTKIEKYDLDIKVYCTGEALHNSQQAFFDAGSGLANKFIQKVRTKIIKNAPSGSTNGRSMALTTLSPVSATASFLPHVLARITIYLLAMAPYLQQVQ